MSKGHIMSIFQSIIERCVVVTYSFDLDSNLDGKSVLIQLPHNK